jgi:CRP-like cAMP-binding protein
VALCIPEFDYFPFRIIDSGYYFGEIDLLFGSTRKFCTKAVTDVELYVLEKKCFEEIYLKKFEDVGKKMFSLAV